MPENRRRGVRYSRRDFARLALVSLPSVSLFRGADSALARQAKPNSVWGGVPFGIFAPYRFGPEASDLEGALKALVNFGVSQTELSNAVVERYLGAPQPAGRGGGGGGGGRGTQTPEQQAAARAAAEQLTAWRTSIPIDKFKAVRQMFDTAGVTIYAYRLTLRADMPDAEYDYTFNAAKALGATQITMELPADRARLAAHRRLRRQAQGQRRLPPAHDGDHHRLGRGDGAVAAQRAAARHRPLRRGHGHQPGAADREAPRPHLQHAPEGSEACRTRSVGEHALGRRGHADQRTCCRC